MFDSPSASFDWNGIPVRVDEDMPPDEFEVMHPDEPIEDVRRRAWDRRRRRLVQPAQGEFVIRPLVCSRCGREVIGLHVC